MYANVLVKEPLEKIMEDWDYLHERVLSHFATFKPMGQNIYGVRRGRPQSRPPDEIVPGPVSYVQKRPSYGTLILGPGGVEVKQSAEMEISITPGGLPHHTPHSFGYWHINDMDELSIRLPGATPDQPGSLLLIMGVPKPGETDRWAWYCEQCLTFLFERVYQTGALGFNGFWKAERDAVASYNADPQNQRCPECGLMNAKGYCWNPAKDTPDEQQARAAW